MATTELIPQLRLRVRLALITAMLSGVAMVILALALYQALAANLLRSVDERLVVAAQHLSELRYQEMDPNSTLSERAVTMSERIMMPGIVAKVITEDDQSHILSAHPPAEIFPDDSRLIAAARAGQTSRGTVQLRSGEPVRLLALPIETGKQASSILVVGESLQEMQAILVQVRNVLLSASVLVPVLVTAGVALLMAPSLTAISTLTAWTADVVASENYRKRLALTTQRDEIYQLSATINDLISTVQRTLDQQRQFLAFTSHELRSPLTVILANLDLLRRDLTPEERTLSVTEAMEEARRMRSLVNDLLLLAEKDSTRMIARTPMRLDSLIEETVSVIVRQAETHHVHVDIEAPVVVEGDPERLMQVVRNLIENALIHTPAGTLVEVRLTQTNGCARITVADNGPGIAPEHLPHLWDRFYRVDRARSRVKDSTGLGLPIVEYIAEAHGGSVTVESTLGHGSTFTVLLPLAIQSA